ncbi:MAG: hypothetical protein QOF89_5961 [Acidobacteriota bacterium]|jgi:hypothetical protein|nr:hypothetical protein [Acidobacteriota bacterium]
MKPSLASRWWAALLDLLQSERQVAQELRRAALERDLAAWTSSLSEAVVLAFGRLGMPAAAKGIRSTVLPVRRNEYLGLDVTAFAPTSSADSWAFPDAICELENSTTDIRVAYSLWKVLCIRCALRAVFCYRQDAQQVVAMPSMLASSVLSSMPTEKCSSLPGDTLLIVGTRAEASTFPYSFFRTWKLNPNTCRFESFSRFGEV